MNSSTRFLAGFAITVAIVFLVSAIMMHTVVPAAEAWSAQNCQGQAADGCTAVNGFLAWWWVALLVIVVPTTLIGSKKLFGK
jgi:hypothetical protein